MLSLISDKYNLQNEYEIEAYSTQFERMTRLEICLQQNETKSREDFYKFAFSDIRIINVNGQRLSAIEINLENSDFLLKHLVSVII